MFAHAQYVYKPYMIYALNKSYGSLWCIFSSLCSSSRCCCSSWSHARTSDRKAFCRTPWNRTKALTYCRSNIQRPNNVNFGCVKRNYILCTMTWGWFGGWGRPKKSLSIYLILLFRNILWWLQSSDWILRPSKNCWVFGLETFSMQLRNYQKSMGPGPITNTRHFAKFCTIYFPWFSLSITVILL